jgi:hypothetical protein
MCSSLHESAQVQRERLCSGSIAQMLALASSSPRKVTCARLGCCTLVGDPPALSSSAGSNLSAAARFTRTARHALRSVCREGKVA